MSTIYILHVFTKIQQQINSVWVICAPKILIYSLLEADELALAEKEKQALQAKIASLEAALANTVPAAPKDPMDAVLEKIKSLETRLEEKDKEPERTKPKRTEPAVVEKPSKTPPVDDDSDSDGKESSDEESSDDEFITTPSGKEVLLIN